MTSRRNLLGGLLGLAGAITIGGCSSSTTGASTAGASAAPTKLRVGVVPGVDIGLLYLANEQGVFKSEGLTLEISEVQGPQVVTSVVSDQFDIGYAAWAPPLLAVGAGTDLVAVSGLATIGEKGHNGATLVRKDAGIKTWKDLAGTKVGATAPRSLTALTLQQAIKLDGGTAPVEVVPLPQNQLGKAANDGSVMAVAVVEPFPAQALKEYPALMSLGDSTGQVFPVGAAYTGFFTTSKKAAGMKAAVDAFRRGMAKAVEFENKNPGEVKKAGAKLAGLDEATALTLPDGRFSAGVDQAGLDILVKAMVDQAWIKTAPNLSTFLSGLK